MQKIILCLMGIFLMSGCASQATFGSAITEGEPTPLPTPIIPNKPIYQVERGDIIYQRRYFGRVTPVLSQNLYFELDGQITEILIDDGDTVATGDVIARLDTSLLESQLIDAQEELSIAQSLLDSATNQVDFGKQRAQLLLDLAQLQLDYSVQQSQTPPTTADEYRINQRTIERDLAQLELEQLENGVDPALRFDVARAQKRVDEIQAQIDLSQLTAPMDGHITSLPIDEGDFVTAFNTIGIVADTSLVEVTTTLALLEMGELTEGMPVILQNASLPDDVFTGTITQLPEPYGTGSGEQTHITFDNPPSVDAMPIGTRVSFTVTIEERQDVLWLPVSAIRQFSGRNFVVIQNDSVQQRIDVKLGLEGDNRVEILEGLEEDQTVIGP